MPVPLLRAGFPKNLIDGASGASDGDRCTSVPPQMFREGIGVVVEGTVAKDGVFESHRLMVSHGNEYRAPGDPASVGAPTKRVGRSSA